MKDFNDCMNSSLLTCVHRMYDEKIAVQNVSTDQLGYEESYRRVLDGSAVIIMDEFYVAGTGFYPCQMVPIPKLK